MAYDPLSRSTRVARTTFLVIGTTAAVAWGFGIELKELDSVKIPYRRDTMDAVLTIATAYTFIAFLVAYFDDLRHMEKTPLEQMRQAAMADSRRRRRPGWRQGGVPCPVSFRWELSGTDRGNLSKLRWSGRSASGTTRTFV